MRNLVRSLVLLVALSGCAGSQDQPTTEPNDDRTESAQPLQPDVEQMTGALARQDLIDVLGRSAGDFLRHVLLEPEVDGGSFVGWRVV